ncbi:MAG: acyl carrier protein [Acidimicrobiia bacterium]|nr:acyl carrier protein [Acidimicrobiia bacterium]MDH3396848.1 acyl carrier protein [Acidimicrobiia bacterium]
MDRSEIESRIKNLLVSELGLDGEKVSAEARFEEDLEVDSLGVVELLMALEDEFGVKIPDEEAEEIGTVGEAVDMVVAKLAG